MDRDESSTPSQGSEAGRFRHLFENLQDAIVEFEFEDGAPIIRTVNEAFCRLFGVDADEVVGTDLNARIVPNERQSQSDRFDRRTATGKANYAIVDRHTEDGVQTLLYRGIPYQGGDRGFAVYTDLTDEIRQERELAVLNRVLQHNVSSHVETLVAHAETLLETLDDPELADTAAAVHESALALDRTSTEARDIERALDADPSLTATDLDGVVETALADVPLTDRADVHVDVDDVPPVMTGGHLDRALAALVDNAIRYAGTATPNVRVTAHEGDGQVTVTVSDDGPGLPETEREVLTGKMSVTPLDHGSGLGLWLVRWIVTAYGGDVTYADRPNGGSDITLTLRSAAGRQ
ncbi:PAS domain-containing sensor histidine kinase [Halorientalis litorea]|uniref:PAS domain-containing sensor histidine kinase n=1 Tax=Halorientalis litorea TaxID=2931977 RepID=UPI001FF49500|nr:ATP-binding protein [Halorientalis litorea]